MFQIELKGSALLKVKLLTVHTKDEVVINRVIKDDTKCILSEQCVIGAGDHYVTVVYDKIEKTHQLFAYVICDKRHTIVGEDAEVAVIDGTTYLIMLKKNLTQLSRDRMVYCKVLAIIDEAKYVAQFLEVQQVDPVEAPFTHA